jgi:hypothetical protein
MKSNSRLAGMIEALKSKPELEPTWLPFSGGTAEIGESLGLPHEAASMLLYGLCATGNVRCLNDQGEFVDEDECTIRAFGGEAAFVAAEDVRAWLAEWSDALQPSRLRAEIAQRLKAGDVPGRNIPWKQFEQEVRTACKAKPRTRGFDHRTFQRIVRELRSK